MLLKNSIAFFKLKPALSVGFLFFAGSLLNGMFGAAIPGIKERMAFSDGELGLSLFLSPLGAISGVFLSTKVFKKIPVGNWLLAGTLINSLIMLAMINAVNRPMLWICLYCFGVAGFLNGVSTNTTVSNIEQTYKRNIMSTCHAMYSLGLGVSGALSFFLFRMDIISGMQILIAVVFIYFVMLMKRKQLLSHRQIIHSGSGLRLPSLSILGISFICMVVFMSEGCILDWSAIYLKESLHVPKQLMTLGFIGFSIAMTLGRLNGDNIISRFGNRKVVITGMLIASLGFIIVVLANSLVSVVTGFTLAGIGCSCVVPVLFSTAARIPGVTPVEGFAMVTTGGLVGFLTGPPIIGFISEWKNLSTGLSLLILLTLLGAYTAWKNQFLAIKKFKVEEIVYDEQIY